VATVATVVAAMVVGRHLKSSRENCGDVGHERRYGCSKNSKDCEELKMRK
jgi:hypothetical protein